MTEKPKKSKKRIPQWQFLLTWIGGQYGAFFATALTGIILIVLLNMLGITLDSIPVFLQLLAGGAVLGWFSGWIQQWSMRKHFGHDVKGWRTISAILTALAFSLVIPFVAQLAYTRPLLFENPSSITFIVSVTFMTLFGTAGIGQAFLLRKHVKHAWLFFLSTLVAGMMYGLPVLGNSSYFVAQMAQYSVTAFAILWLFGMSGTMDALQSQDDAIQRLSDATDEDDLPDYGDDEEQQYGRDNLWKNLFRRLGFAI